MWPSFVRWLEALHLGRPARARLGTSEVRSGLVGWVEALHLGPPAVVLVSVVVSLPLCGLAMAGPVVGAVVTGAVVVAAWRARRGADARRLAAADAQLPTLLEAVARHLRTGGSLTEAITAQQPGGGLAEPWLVVAVRAPVAGVVAALDGWVAGDDRPPVRLAAAALALAAETGGSPARAVDGVAATLRARAAVAGELRALTSQARASALVIAISPVVFALLASATDRRTRAAFHTGTGTLLVLAGLALDALGAWWMARLCRLPVTVGP